jgi:hypothetical protein
MYLRVEVIELTQDHAWIEVRDNDNDNTYIEMRVDRDSNDRFQAPYVSERGGSTHNVLREYERYAWMNR